MCRSLVRRLAALTLACAAVLPARAQLLYRAERGGQTVYLLGAVHLLPRDGSALGPAVDAAYAASSALAFELTPEAMATAGPLLMRRGLLPADSTLLQVVPDSLHAPLAPYLAGPLGGLLPRARPWLALMLVGQVVLAEAGYDARSGVEAQVIARAATDGRPVHAFETVEEQVRLFADAPLPEQVRDLADALVNGAEATERLDALVGRWRAGDAAGLDAALTAEFAAAPARRARLLDARNRAWMPRLNALAAGTATLFVVVGAGHLVGERGLAALLEADGWAVSQVDTSIR